MPFVFHSYSLKLTLMTNDFKQWTILKCFLQQFVVHIADDSVEFKWLELLIWKSEMNTPDPQDLYRHGFRYSN